LERPQIDKEKERIPDSLREELKIASIFRNYKLTSLEIEEANCSNP